MVGVRGGGGKGAARHTDFLLGQSDLPSLKVCWQGLKIQILLFNH